MYGQPITLISSQEVEVCKQYLKFSMGNNDINLTLPKGRTKIYKLEEIS